VAALRLGAATVLGCGGGLLAAGVGAGPGTQAYTTDYSYNDATGLGWLSQETTPDGVTTQYAYNPAGEKTSVTNGAGDTTSYSDNSLGEQTKVTYPDGTATATGYDEAGDVTSTTSLDASGNTLATTSAAFDGEGDQLSATDAAGNSTTFTYDPTGLVTQETQPVSATSGITTSFGYDAAGNQTLYTDGNGSQWWDTYNTWGLQQSRIEPPTAAYTTPANSTFTLAYDADQNPVTETEPGGVTVSSTYKGQQQLVLVGGLVFEVPGGFGGVAGVVGVVGAGGGGGAAVVAPGEVLVGEDADGGAARGAQGDGIFVFEVGRVWGGGGHGDLEGLGVDHAQEGEGGLHLVGGGLGEAVGAGAGGGVAVGVGFGGRTGDDGVHGLLQLASGVDLGPSAVLVAPRRPAWFSGCINDFISQCVRWKVAPAWGGAAGEGSWRWGRRARTVRDDGFAGLPCPLSWANPEMID